MEFDGALISELGAQKYLVGANAQQYANIQPLQSQSMIQKAGTSVTLDATHHHYILGCQRHA